MGLNPDFAFRIYYGQLVFVLVNLLFCFNAFSIPLDGLTNLEGKPATLSHTKNKELVIFWATWCPSCREHLKENFTDTNKDVAVIAISFEKEIERVRNFVQKYKLQIPVLLDTNKTLYKSLQIDSIPHWAVYHRDSTQVGGWVLLDHGSGFNKEKIEKVLKISIK